MSTQRSSCKQPMKMWVADLAHNIMMCNATDNMVTLLDVMCMVGMYMYITHWVQLIVAPCLPHHTLHLLSHWASLSSHCTSRSSRYMAFRVMYDNIMRLTHPPTHSLTSSLACSLSPSILCYWQRLLWIQGRTDKGLLRYALHALYHNSFVCSSTTCLAILTSCHTWYDYLSVVGLNPRGDHLYCVARSI